MLVTRLLLSCCRGGYFFKLNSSPVLCSHRHWGTGSSSGSFREHPPLRDSVTSASLQPECSGYELCWMQLFQMCKPFQASINSPEGSWWA